jgi:hypothetical protein
MKGTIHLQPSRMYLGDSVPVQYEYDPGTDKVRLTPNLMFTQQDIDGVSYASNTIHSLVMLDIQDWAER